jgi:di/tricarboxylate transporter
MNLSVDQSVVFAILSATLVLFVWGRWRYDLVALAALVLVFVAGLIPAGQVFLGFGHPAVITVAAVLVLSRGLLNAGVVDALSRYLARVGSRPMAQVGTLTGIVILCSGFMNNVGALALLMPVAIWMSRQSGRPPSLLLMPLAFGSFFHLTSAPGKETEATVVGLIRGERHIPAPSWYEIIQAGDILMVEATPEDLKALIDEQGLSLAECKGDCKATLGSDDIRLMEAVIASDSPLAGKTATRLHLRRNFGVNLLAIARRGRRLERRLGRTELVIGDILLLQGGDESLQTVLKTFKCLPLAERGLRIGQPRKVLLALGIFVAAMVLSALNLLPVQIAFTAAAVIMIVVDLVPLGDIYESIDWPVIVLLGAMFPLGQALESTGGAQLIAAKLLLLSAHLSPMATLAMTMVGTMLLSNVVNNAAAAVLMAPIAITLARGMAVSVDPLLMTVAVGASCAFLTPVGHQSNALVMAPGGYRFGDYWRLGLPLSILVTLVAVPLILYFWPMAPL